MRAVRIAAIQLTPGDDKTRNLALVAKLVEKAARARAQLIALPECFSHVGSAAEMRRQAERPRDGQAYLSLSRLARQHGVHILAGSIAMRGDRSLSKIVTNRSVLFAPSGREIAHYDKIHLFDTRVAGVSYRETATFAPGSRLCVASTPLGRLGLTICYDLRFPELFRALTLAGARIIFVPAAFTAHTGKAHWLTLLRARAIESQTYIVAPALCGSFEKKSWYGNSCIIDPWGRVVAQAGNRPAVLTAELDLAALEKIRRDLPALRHIRPDVFRGLRRA